MNKIIIISAIVVVLLFVTSPKAKASDLSSSDKSLLLSVSYLNRKDLPLGIRNNNPGNIRPDGVSNWQGMLDVQNNFIRFSGFVWGVRALIKQIRDADLGKNGIKTIQDLVQKYSPVSDNTKDAVNNYILALIKHTSFNNGIIPDSSKNSVKLIVTGIADHENGSTNVIEDKMFEFAWLLSYS